MLALIILIIVNAIAAFNLCIIAVQSALFIAKAARQQSASLNLNANGILLGICAGYDAWYIGNALAVC